MKIDMNKPSVHHKVKLALVLGLALFSLASETCLAARPPTRLAAKVGKRATRASDSDGIQCLNNDGFAVDFFAVFKYPDGSAYGYADNRQGHITTSTYYLNSSTDGAVAHTLNQIYQGDQGSVGYVQYNDEWPDNHKHGTGGHTKGFLGFDEQGGFWLIHSVPRFPTKVSDGDYPGLPEDEFTYGQSFLCISTSLTSLDTVSKNLVIGHPWVYDSNVPNNPTFNELQYLNLLAAGQRGIDGVDFNTDSIHSNAGVEFTLFYKSPDWGKYLYEEGVEPYYHCGFMWETWMNGVNPDPSFCTGNGSPYQYNSTNIRHLRMDWYSQDIQWKETQDHSKWGISNEWYDHNMIQVTCIGDINRQESQNGRGGGTTCFEFMDLWYALTIAVDEHDQCS